MATITRETLMEKMNKANEAAIAYVELYNSPTKQKKQVLNDAKKKADSLIAEYNDDLAAYTYKVWAAEGDPVKTGIRMRYVQNCKKFQFKTDDDDVMAYTIKPIDYLVNLLKMREAISNDIFHEYNWYDKVQKLAYYVANYIGLRTGDGTYNHIIEESAKAFDFPEGVDPTTDDGVLAAFQMVIDAIIFVNDPDNDGKNLYSIIEKIDKNGRPYAPEWEVVRESFTGAGGMNMVKIASNDKFLTLVVNAIHGIMTAGTFGVVVD